MNDIDSIYGKLDQGGEVGDIRSDIVDLIVDRLQDSLGYWEKLYFANAIAALAWNKSSSGQLPDSWLRLCLFNVEMALVPAEQRNEDYIPKDNQFDSLTYDQLMDAILEIQ